MASSLRDIEASAVRAIRRAAADRRPVDAGNVQAVVDAIRAAYSLGRKDTTAEAVDAYRIYIDTDDLDEFRDALTGLMELAGLLPAAGAVKEE